MKSFNCAALFYLPRYTSISTLWKSSRHPCWVVTSIRINLALSALIFCVSEKENKLANNLHFDLQPDLWQEIFGVEYAETYVSEENQHSLVWGEDTPPHQAQIANADLQSCLLSSVLLPCSLQFCNTMGWAWQHLTTILQVTIIMQCIKWKRIRLWWSIVAFRLVEEREVSQQLHF